MILPRAFRANEGGRMGMEVQEKTETLIDTYGVPEFFASGVMVEDAGGGNVRQINYIERRGILVPTVCVVRPSEAIVQAAPKLLALCRKIMLGAGVAH
jgi:hypothetical protein